MKALDAGLPPTPPQHQHWQYLPRLSSLRENAAEAAAEAAALAEVLVAAAAVEETADTQSPGWREEGAPRRRSLSNGTSSPLRANMI